MRSFFFVAAILASAGQHATALRKPSSTLSTVLIVPRGGDNGNGNPFNLKGFEFSWPGKRQAEEPVVEVADDDASKQQSRQRRLLMAGLAASLRFRTFMVAWIAFGVIYKMCIEPRMQARQKNENDNKYFVPDMTAVARCIETVSPLPLGIPSFAVRIRGPADEAQPDYDVPIVEEIKEEETPPPQIQIESYVAPRPHWISRPEQAVVDTCTYYQNQHPSLFAHVATVELLTASDLQTVLSTPVVRGGAEAAVGQKSALAQNLLVGVYFFLWYALNVVYNIVNKRVLNALPAPMVIGTIQFGVGALYATLVWVLGLRATPSLTSAGQGAVVRVGFWHAFGQLASMISLGAGTVSFTHIVKALEPFFSAIVSGFYFSKWMKPQVYATLIPVVGGVGYACLKERSFSMLSFQAAMLSNLAFALRAVLSKVTLQSGSLAGTNLSPPNMFGLVTWAAFFLSIPMAAFLEGRTFFGALELALNKVDNNWHFARTVIISGLLHYLNNEVMYLALGSVHPVTLAVGNTMKRVFIMVASVIVFRNHVSMQAGIGAAIGISGVLLYSLTKQYYEALETKEAAALKRKPRFSRFRR